MDAGEQQDIRAACNGDGEAYARLVRRHQDGIARYMLRFARRREVLEELVQEVFVEAYFSLRSFKARSPLEHWLRRIATRVGYRYWKHRGRREQPLSTGEWEQIRAAGDGPMEAAAAGELMHRLLGQLPPRDRLVLTLLYAEEQPVAEVARLTGWTRTMVKVQAYRARAKLRRLLEIRP